jgi:hypothetical protein
MRKTLGYVSALALMAGLAASATGPLGAVAQKFSPVTGAEAASVLHQSAINGTVSNYAVIAPTFLGNGVSGPQSYIRLFNGAGLANATTTSTFGVTIVGAQTGQVYGSSFTLAIPHMASIQYDLNELVSMAGVTPGTYKSGDSSYVVYLQNSDSEAGFQHAVYDWGSKLFENISICDSLLNEQMSSLHNEMVLTNVHTSVGPNKIGVNFPSTIRIHNYYNVPITYTLTILNAGSRTGSGAISASSGKQICQITGQTVAANTTLTLPVSTTIESNAACSSITSADYLNVVIADQSGGAPNAAVSDLLFVSALNGSTSMTPTCAVNKPTTSGGGGVVVSPYT